MRNYIRLPLAALIAGAAGFILRKWQWMTAYDQDSELFLRGSPATYALVGMLLAVAVVFFLLTRKAAPEDTPLPPACPDTLYMCLMAAGAFLFFAAGVLGLLEGMEQLQLWRIGAAMVLSYPAALLLCGGLCLVSGVAVLAIGKSAYRPGFGSDKAGLLAVLPPFTMLVWLFATHQAHATDPIFLRYGVYLTAAGLLMMSHYDVAGFYQGCRHTHRFLFCSLMGCVLALTSLADGLSMFQMAMAAACVLPALGQCFALLSPAADPEL